MGVEFTVIYTVVIHASKDTLWKTEDVQMQMKIVYLIMVTNVKVVVKNTS